jgi:hypothetical protein
MARIDMFGGRGGDCTAGGFTVALGSFLPPEIRNFRLRKAKGLLMQRHALEERNHNCPFKVEEPS